MLTNRKYHQYILSYPYRIPYNKLCSKQSLSFFLKNNFIFFGGCGQMSGFGTSGIASGCR